MRTTARQCLRQFAYCNAVTLFHAAEEQNEDGKLVVPLLGISPRDRRVCPSVRSFAHVEQDQSDNVTPIYLFTSNGQVAQNSAANRTQLATSVARGNPVITGSSTCSSTEPWDARPGPRLPWPIAGPRFPRYPSMNCKQPSFKDLP